MKNSLNALKGRKKRKSKTKKSSNQEKSKTKSKRKTKKKKKFDINNNTNEQNLPIIHKPLFIYSDKKTFLLLKRTYYMQELAKVERYINSEKFFGENFNLTKDEHKRLVMEYNNLLILEKLYINIEDLFKSLQLQNKIINILKIYLMNKTKQK